MTYALPHSSGQANGLHSGGFGYGIAIARSLHPATGANRGGVGFVSFPHDVQVSIAKASANNFIDYFLGAGGLLPDLSALFVHSLCGVPTYLRRFGNCANLRLRRLGFFSRLAPTFAVGEAQHYAGRQ